MICYGFFRVHVANEFSQQNYQISTLIEKPCSSFGGVGANFVGKFSVVLLVWGRIKWWEDELVGRFSVVLLFSTSHPTLLFSPTVFSYHKWGEPQIICRKIGSHQFFFHKLGKGVLHWSRLRDLRNRSGAFGQCGVIEPKISASPQCLRADRPEGIVKLAEIVG